MKTKQNKYYVYIHLKKGTDEVFYVGKGTRSRCSTHDGRNPFWHNVVNKYGFDYQKIEENLYEEQAFELEKFWIAQFKAWNFKLTNLTEGGEGNGNPGNKSQSGIKQSAETIAKRSAKLRGQKKKTLGIKQQGANNNNAKKIYNVETGRVYNCIKDAVIELGITCYESLRQALNRDNKWNLRYV